MSLQTIEAVMLMAVAALPARGQTIVYVDDSAPTGGDGQSWVTAYKFLQDALTIATAGDDIWVVAGTYFPDRNTSNPTGTGDRSATFQFISGVAVYGGLAGNEDPATFNLANRDFVTNVTILSGDLAVDDVANPGDGLACFSGAGLAYETGCGSWDVEPPGGDGDVDCADLGICENSYHVATLIGSDNTTVLDGFTISGGNADGVTDDSGAGLSLGPSNPTLRNCVISNNRAKRHGGGDHGRRQPHSCGLPDCAEPGR
ncbi:MAG: hypothetical protein ACE5EQ_05560 [Phycisphaerae bacterium]